MPIFYDISDDKSFVLARCEGIITSADFRGMHAAYWQDPDFSLTRPHVVDLHAMINAEHDLDMLRSDIAIMEALYHKAPQPLRVAIYGGEGVVYGVARMFMGLAEVSQTLDAQYFPDRASAITWAVSGDEGD